MYEYHCGWVLHRGGYVFRWIGRRPTDPHYCMTTVDEEGWAIDGLEYV